MNFLSPTLSYKILSIIFALGFLYTTQCSQISTQRAARIHEKEIVEKLLLELNLDIEDIKFNDKSPLVLRGSSNYIYQLPENEAHASGYILTYYLKGTIHEKESVEELLLEMGLQIEDASLSDEPPGVLRILKFITTGAQNQKYEIRFSLQRSPALFSKKRQWKQDLAKSAYLSTITIRHLPFAI